MERVEKLMVRLDSDTVILLQKLVDNGNYDSLSEAVAAAVNDMTRAKFTPKEIFAILQESKRDRPIDVNSLLSDNDNDRPETDDVIRKAVSDYVRSKMGPEE